MFFLCVRACLYARVCTLMLLHWNNILTSLLCLVQLIHSHYYLLTLWSRLIASTYYMRGPKPSLLEEYAPKVCEAFVSARLELVPALLRGTATTENPMDDEDQLNELLESLPYLGRCKFAETSAQLAAAFDPLAAAFEKQLLAGDSASLVLVQDQLAWLAYVVGAIVGGRLGVNSTEDYDQFDGELAARIFQLMALVDAAVARVCINTVHAQHHTLADIFRNCLISYTLIQTEQALFTEGFFSP